YLETTVTVTARLPRPAASGIEYAYPFRPRWTAHENPAGRGREENGGLPPQGAHRERPRRGRGGGRRPGGAPGPDGRVRPDRPGRDAAGPRRLVGPGRPAARGAPDARAVPDRARRGPGPGEGARTGGGRLPGQAVRLFGIAGAGADDPAPRHG